MSLGGLVSALSDHLSATLVPAPALVGGAVPAAEGELPAVTISIGEASERVGGIGAIGATAAADATAEAAVDLARPAPAILSKDRRTLGLPLGPPVEALAVALGGKPLAVVAKAPGKGEVQANADRCELRFGAALPATGKLSLRYRVGELRSTRWQGAVQVDVRAADPAGVDALSGQVATALAVASRRVAGLHALGLRSWGPVEAPAGGARLRTIGCRFDYEAVEPLVAGDGGPLKVVSVESHTGDDGREVFDVQREGS